MHADVTELREQLPAKENEVLCSLLAHLMASHATYVLATMQCPRQHRPTSLQLIGQHHPCPLAKRLQHGNARCTRNRKRRIAPISASASFPNAVMSPDQVRNCSWVQAACRFNYCFTTDILSTLYKDACCLSSRAATATTCRAVSPAGANTRRVSISN